MNPAEKCGKDVYNGMVPQLSRAVYHTGMPVSPHFAAAASQWLTICSFQPSIRQKHGGGFLCQELLFFDIL
jgi:hypothetical protein